MSAEDFIDQDQTKRYLTRKEFHDKYPNAGQINMIPSPSFNPEFTYEGVAIKYDPILNYTETIEAMCIAFWGMKWNFMLPEMQGFSKDGMKAALNKYLEITK